MSAQLKFDFQAAEAARDLAVQHAADGAGEDWMLNALYAIRRVAEAKATFTTDDLWVHIDPPSEPRAMGAAMVEARRQGLCEPTDRTKRSHRRACHARPLRVWQSLVCDSVTP